MIVEVDGEKFDIPDSRVGGGLTGRELKNVLKVNKPILYEVTDAGHALVADDEAVPLRPGQRFGAMERVVAGGRNVSRINGELKLLVAKYGQERVDWTPDQAWVLLHCFELPAGYNRTETNLLIAVPEQYGHGVPLRECYVDPSLRYSWDGKWVEIPHYFDAAGRFAPQSEARKQNWRYLCLHMVDWTSTSNFQTFLRAIYTFLSNPMYPWPTK